MLKLDISTVKQELNMHRNFIFKDKYKEKNPGKYHKLEAPPRDTSGSGDRRSRGEDDHLGGLTEQFSRGMNRLRSFGGDEESHHRDRGQRSQDGGDMPRIQMVRRYENPDSHPLSPTSNIIQLC